MKALITAVLIMVSGVSYADKVLLTKNGVGGVIALTDQQPEVCGANHLAYATEPNSANDPADFNTYWGCWAVYKGDIYIRWFAGAESHLGQNDFQMVEQEKVVYPGGRTAMTPPGKGL